MAYYSRSALSRLFKKSPLEPKTSIELLQVHRNEESGKTGIVKHDILDDDILTWIAPSNHAGETRANVQMLFLSSVREDGCTTNKLNVTAPTLEKMSAEFKISLAFWDAVLIPSTWSKQSGGLFHRYSGKSLAYIEGFYHYFNEWDKGPLHVWCKYDVQNAVTTYVLVDCPEYVKTTILENAEDEDDCFLHRPLAIDLLITERCASWREELIHHHYRQIFVWHERKGIMDMDPPLKPEVLDKNGLQKLHQLSRTWNMIYEDLGDLKERIDVLIETASALEAAQVEDVQSAIESFKFIQGRNQLRRRWVTSFGERTKLIIGFVFGIASQEDNQTNMAIANFTSTIAEETRQDNSSMITIATMTMLFLPGTFVCTVFGMGFFRYGTDSEGHEIFQVSSYWWLFPTIAIPCTLLVMAVYQIWRRNREGRMKSKRRQNSLTEPEKADEQMP